MTGAEAGATGTDADVVKYPYRRVHRLTPLLRFWTLILALLAVAVVNINLSVISTVWAFLTGGNYLPILAGLAGFLVACALIWLISQVWWKATGYRLTDEEVSLKRGVLSRQLRTARYDRIQAVDVVESVIARIFRLAAVRVETAGGGRSVIEIAYLGRGEAEALRAELLARVHGPGPGPGPGPDTTLAQPDLGETGAAVVPVIPITRSLTAAALRGATIVGVLTTVLLFMLPVPLATVIPIIVGLFPVIWNQIDRSWQFTARLDGEGDRAVLNLSYGLADRRRQSIPLRRIHGVTVWQPALWRPLGWWMVSVSVAGYGAESDKSTGTSTILPVGSRRQAVEVLALVSPLDESDIEETARPEGRTRPTFLSPPTARWVSPVDLRQQAVTLRDDAVITHRGRLRRHVSVIEPSHIQEVTLRRGPLQQLIGLCTVRLDLVPGPVGMEGEDLTEQDGRALLDVLRRRRLPELTPDGRTDGQTGHTPPTNPS